MSDNPEALPRLTEAQIDSIVDGGGHKAGPAQVWSAYDFANAITDAVNALWSKRAALAQQAATPALFASSVARRKWESLQADGHRMQRLYFERADGSRGTIDAWGVVMWGDAAVRQAATPVPAEPVATPFGKTPQQHLDDAVKWLDTRRERLHHEGCSVHEPSARCNCGLHKTLTDVRAVRNWLETQSQPTCDECGKSKSDGWALYCVACAESALAAPPATPEGSQP